jgi:hypothetical protein
MKNSIKKGTGIARSFFAIRSALRDGTCRADACAGATLDAGISIDNVLRISLRDSSYRALRLACSARNARIRNYICHGIFLL